MADYSDEERQKRLIENQPYDETLEVPDAEDVASVYTPTPRHPKNLQYQQALLPNNKASNQQHSQHQQQSRQSRPTPPPTSSSVSSGSINDNQNQSSDYKLGHQKIVSKDKSSKMSDSQLSDTPKDNENLHQNQLHEDMDDSEGVEGNDSGDDSQDNGNDLTGGYDPAAFRDLPVSSEIKDIFKYIERYQPQNIELDFKLKPFIPDYIPSIGDIDAFIKVPRPDGKQDNLGLTVLDEPSSNQSDPHVLDLYFRTLSKQTAEVNQPTVIKSVDGSNIKAIDSWIKNISALQKNKPVQTVNYQRAMPSIDQLMQVWPQEFEELLKEVSLPSPDLNVDLNTYIDIIAALLDIPIYKSRIQSVHLMFSLFSEFKNSEHFKNPSQSMTNNLKLSQSYDNKRSRGGADQLVID